MRHARSVEATEPLQDDDDETEQEGDSFESKAPDSSDSEDSSSEPDVPQGCAPPWLQRFVLSETFSVIFAALIVLNIIVMMIQADYPHLRRGASRHNYWEEVNLSFLVLFVVELALRLVVFGCSGFFRSHDWRWNVFDFVIVLLGAIDVLMRLCHLGSRGGRFIMLARSLRILRVLRILRLLRTCRQLMMLARGLIESVAVVFWIFFLIVFLIYIAAIFFTSSIGQHADDWGDEAADVKLYFGTMAQSMFTLFQFLTLDNWNDVDQLIVKQMPWMQPWFFLFIGTASFVILALLTGVMADHMDQVRKEEEDDQRKINRQSQEHMVDIMNKTFRRSMPKDAAYMTKQEFAHIFEDRQMSASLEVEDIQLTAVEALELFEIFDKDGDGVLMWHELQVSLEEYRNGFSAMQFFKVEGMINRLADDVCRSGAGMPELCEKPKPSPAAEKQLEQTELRIQGLDRRLERFDKLVREMMTLYDSKGATPRTVNAKDEDDEGM